MVCMTSGVEKIPEKLLPFNFVGGEISEGFLRYLANWFSEAPGMRDARKHAVEYVALLKNALGSDKTNIL